VVNQIVTVSGRPRVGPTPEAISADVRVYARALASLTFPQKLKLAEALGLVAPSVSPSEPMISKRLRDYLDQARMSVESFNEFKRIFDESVRS